VPFVTTAGFTPSPGGFDFGGFIDAGLRIADRFFPSKAAAPVAFDPRFQTFDPRFGQDPRFQQASLAGPLIRGGGALLRKPAVQGLLGGIGGQGLFEGIEDFFSGGAATESDLASFTDPVPGACRPKAHRKVNPCTGKSVWFTPQGRPLVFSGDLSACRRVSRVAKQLTKGMPRRASAHSHRRKR